MELVYFNPFVTTNLQISVKELNCIASMVFKEMYDMNYYKLSCQLVYIIGTKLYLYSKKKNLHVSFFKEKKSWHSRYDRKIRSP